MRSGGHDRASDAPARKRRPVRRFLLVALVALACILIAGVLVARHALLASLPPADGTLVLPGLRETVRIDRDTLGIPTIRGSNRLDVARATGLVHAQERFFQMDILRRLAAGELSELFGSGTLATDRLARIHRLRAVARQVLARASGEQRAPLVAYAEGVNAGLASLGARPPEYWLLRCQPVEWKAEDSLLVIGTMFINDLGNTRRERDLGAMYDLLPGPLADFLRPLGDEWDAPLVGGPPPPPPMPGPEVFTLSATRSEAARRFWPSGRDANERAGDAWALGTAIAGSNAWAIAGSHTSDGRTLVANDPHLALNVPNIWFRMALEWRDARGASHGISGASLPGVPYVAIGSNGHVAWGFTVAFDDRSDLVIVEPEGNGRARYRTPHGALPFEHAVEKIKVRGGDDARLDITSTIWGPIVGTDAHGRSLALNWQPHHPDAINVELAGMETATTVEQSLDIANRSGLPSYNMIVADDRGSIGWTVVGRLPRRVGFDGRVPTSWADGSRRWDGWLEPADYPRIVNPTSGRIWSANNRMIDRPLLDRLGLEGYIMGARARQLRDDLTALASLTARGALSIQLDDRALFLDRWRRYLVDELRGDAQRAEFRQLIDRGWDGRASVPSVAYRLVHACRFELARLAIGPLIQRCLAADREFDFHSNSLIEWWESALWRLVHERPRHLLEPKWRDWHALVLAAVDRTIADLTAGGHPLASATWGSTTLPIAHPLSRGVPWLAPWLNMPFQPLPGGPNMPRLRMEVSFGEVGASLRMVVSPGHEAEGIFQMPAGESGHPLSPHYRDMQQSWVEGRPTPFLPGRAVHTLMVKPR